MPRNTPEQTPTPDGIFTENGQQYRMVNGKPRAIGAPVDTPAHMPAVTPEATPAPVDAAPARPTIDTIRADLASVTRHIASLAEIGITNSRLEQQRDTLQDYVTRYDTRQQEKAALEQAARDMEARREAIEYARSLIGETGVIAPLPLGEDFIIPTQTPPSYPAIRDPEAIQTNDVADVPSEPLQLATPAPLERHTEEQATDALTTPPTDTPLPFGKPLFAEQINPVRSAAVPEDFALPKRRRFESLSLLRNKRVLGGAAIAAIVATAAGIGISQHDSHEEAPTTAPEATASEPATPPHTEDKKLKVSADTQLADSLLGSCDSDTSFTHAIMRKTYTATGGVLWTTNEGKPQANGTVHTFGPGEARKTSMITIPNGAIDIALCDDDNDAATTITGNTITLDLDKATVLARVNDSIEGSQATYVPLNLTDAAPTADGTVTQADLTELKKNMYNKTMLSTAQAAMVHSISESLTSDPSLIKETALKAANDQAKAYVAARITDADAKKYTVTVRGAATEFDAMSAIKSTPSAAVGIDKVAVTIKK